MGLSPPATALPAAALLELWEATQVASPVERALLLAAAATGEERERLMDLPIGARDGRIFALRERNFGPRAEAVAVCPACGAMMEAELDLRELRAAAPADEPRAILAEEGGRRLGCRLPTTRDLLSALAAPDEQAARTRLLSACVWDPAEELRPAELEAVSRAVEAGDPIAEVQIALHCPECAHDWEAPFDIAEFLLAELSAAARRLLHEVHSLASAYGWSEREILALSARRRRAYLEALTEAVSP